MSASAARFRFTARFKVALAAEMAEALRSAAKYEMSEADARTHVFGWLCQRAGLTEDDVKRLLLPAPAEDPRRIRRLERRFK